MKVIDPGHVYQLNQLDIDSSAGVVHSNRLIFVKREGDKYPGNVGSHEGTNMQEVLRALIDRVKYVNNQIPDDRNTYIINDLRSALYWLEERAADRHQRKLHVTQPIENMPICDKCGHIGCSGECH